MVVFAVAKYFRGKDYMNAPWLFAEAYKYRVLHSCFSKSKFFKSYDVFFRQKCETFSRSSEAVFELATRFAAPYEPDTLVSAAKQLDAKRLLFHELTQVALWGNATDLSLLINMTEEDIKRLQASGSESLAASEKNIIGNHMDKVWDHVSSDQFGGPDKKGGRFDIVMDNAGFELYSDLVYADWLMQSGLASEVRFHGKRFAWFVSDVTDADFKWLINQMVYGHLFADATDEDIEALRTMGHRWKDYVTQGKWVYEQHPFWSEYLAHPTTPVRPTLFYLIKRDRPCAVTGWTFWDLKAEAPDLFNHLADSDLVIFKGDLNRTFSQNLTSHSRISSAYQAADRSVSFQIVSSRTTATPRLTRRSTWPSARWRPRRARRRSCRSERSSRTWWSGSRPTWRPGWTRTSPGGRLAASTPSYF